MSKDFLMRSLLVVSPLGWELVCRSFANEHDHSLRRTLKCSKNVEKFYLQPSKTGCAEKQDDPFQNASPEKGSGTKHKF